MDLLFQAARDMCGVDSNGSIYHLNVKDIYNFDSKWKKLFLKGRDGTVIGEKVDELVCSPSPIWVVVANEQNNFAGESYDILEV